MYALTYISVLIILDFCMPIKLVFPLLKTFTSGAILECHGF